MKLSATQQAVLDKMRNGWELGADMSLNGWCWIQKGGLGKGGESHNVSWATVSALWNKKLIFLAVEKYPTRKFELVK